MQCTVPNSNNSAGISILDVNANWINRNGVDA